MALDASALQDIQGPDVAGAVSKGFQLKDMINENDLSKLKLQDLKQESDDKQTIRKLSKSWDLKTDAGVAKASEDLTRMGRPEAAMDRRPVIAEPSHVATDLRNDVFDQVIRHGTRYRCP